MNGAITLGTLDGEIREAVGDIFGLKAGEVKFIKEESFMASVISNDFKYTLRYTASASPSSSSESSTRSLAGLNIGAGSSYPDSGPARDGALTNLINTLNAFTVGTFSDWRFITEQGVRV